MNKISVVTVVYNDADHIEATIKSVLDQTYTNIEYIVIDGGSTDGTLALIKKYENAISYFISEKDHGIYDAMNKGIKQASGDYILFMNSGDLFYDATVLSKMATHFSLNYDMIYGDVYVTYNGFGRHAKAGNLNDIKKGMIFCHQSLLAKTTLLKNKPLNTSYTLAADYDFVMQNYHDGKSFFYSNEIIAKISAGGASDNNIGVFRQYENISKNYSHTFKSWLYFRTKIFKIKLAKFAKTMLPQKLVATIIQNKR